MALKRIISCFVEEVSGIQSRYGRIIAYLEGGERIKLADIPETGGVMTTGAVIPEYTLTTTGYPTMVMTRAALRLLATQKSDAGWQWNNPDTDPASGLPTPYNTLGVTAQGILDTYVKSPISSLLNACISTYKAMVSNASDPSPSKHRIRGPDISFLVELAEKTAESTYASFAKTRWESAKSEFGSGMAAGFAEYIRDARKSQGLPALISWDINLYIQGVMALHRYFPTQGYDAEASSMAGVVYNSLYTPPVDFDITDDTQAEFWCGISGALDAFLTTDTHEVEAISLTSQLTAGQQSDGHFAGVNGGSDDQTTTYAIMALQKAGEDRAVISAVSYLLGSQLANGGWSYDGGENTEVTSEVIQAINDYI